MRGDGLAWDESGRTTFLSLTCLRPSKLHKISAILPSHTTDCGNRFSSLALFLPVELTFSRTSSCMTRKWIGQEMVIFLSWARNSVKPEILFKFQGYPQPHWSFQVRWKKSYTPPPHLIMWHFPTGWGIPVHFIWWGFAAEAHPCQTFSDLKLLK